MPVSTPPYAGPRWAMTYFSTVHNSGWIQVQDDPNTLDLNWAYASQQLIVCGFDPRKKQFWYNDDRTVITMHFDQPLLCDRMLAHNLVEEEIPAANYVGTYWGHTTTVLSRAICLRCYDDLNNQGFDLSDMSRI